jgi:hypothetical protein
VRNLIADHALGDRLQRVVRGDGRRVAGDGIGGARRAGQHGADDVARREQARRAGVDDHGVHLVDAHQCRHLGQCRARPARDEPGRHDFAGLDGGERRSASDRVHGQVLRARDNRGIGAMPPSSRGEARTTGWRVARPGRAFT